MHLLIFLMIVAAIAGFVAEHTFISVLIVFLAVCWIFSIWQSQGEKEKKRKQQIIQKYGDTLEAESILNKTPWIGQSREQLIDSFGGAHEIETKVSARVSKEIWKFFYPNSRKLRLRITLTNGEVSHIDIK